MIKTATKEDALTVAKLAIQMWEDHILEELANKFEELIAADDAQIFLKYAPDQNGNNRAVGFAKELLSACQNWAKEKGCTEFASDCELVNEGSLKFHMAMGFEEANRIICFTKKL